MGTGTCAAPAVTPLSLGTGGCHCLSSIRHEGTSVLTPETSKGGSHLTSAQPSQPPCCHGAELEAEMEFGGCKGTSPGFLATSPRAG